MTTTGSQLQLRGFAASPGVVEGTAYAIVDSEPDISGVTDPGPAFTAAAAASAEQLTNLAASAESAGRAEAAEILSAQALMAADPMLADEVQGRIAAGVALGDALVEASENVITMLLESGSEYLAERAADVREIVRRILSNLAGEEPRSLAALTDPAIVVASTLTAADISAMDPATTIGLVTEGGGPTGHVAVIARSLAIPAVVGLAGALTHIENGTALIIDGSSGEVVVNADDATRSDLQARAARRVEMAKAAEAYRGKAITYGERAMSIAANVGNVADIEGATAQESDGIGLFRTEFLFLSSDRPPTEAEQVAVYTQAASSFEHPVVIRTFDIGGDKPAPYLDIPPEENPFLGVRGIRLYEDHEQLARTQARAILRAAAGGDVWAMAPMVATVDDMKMVRAIFDRARSELEEEGVAMGPIRLGAMVEVPSLALNARAAAAHVDFFSIGTNDLTQYTLAADRTSGALAKYGDAADPGVLKLCAMTARAANERGISVSVCGEAAADPVLALLFAAMGMDKLSVAAGSVNQIKMTVDQANPSALAPLLEACLEASSSEEVRGLVAEAVPS